jgi:hypothetical protein
MVYAPYLVALFAGALISGVIYLVWFWPAVEPPDEE